MINFLIALAAGAAAWLLSALVLDWFWAGMLPFLAVFIGTYIYLARKTNKALEKIALDAQKAMEKAGQARTPKQRDMAIERAIEILKSGFSLQKRQFMVAAQLNGQIGQLYYIQKDFDRARPYLERSYVRNWVARAMLACIHYMKGDYDKMTEVFEKTVKKNEKESLLWNLYAWCLWKAKRRDQAVEVLARGAEKTNNDDRVKSNLDNLRNNKKIKMRGWHEQWYQFHLEAPPQPKQRVDYRGMRGR